MTEHDSFPWHDSARWTPPPDHELAAEPSRDDTLIYEGILAWRERDDWLDGAIDDTTARIIASHWHRGQASALYSFTSTGAIDRREMWGEVVRDFYLAVDQGDDDTHAHLEALKWYVDHHGDRGPVEGWHEMTRW